MVGGEPLGQAGVGKQCYVFGRRLSCPSLPTRQGSRAYLMWRAECQELEAAVVMMVGLGAAGLGVERSNEGFAWAPPPHWCGGSSQA